MGTGTKRQQTSLLIIEEQYLLRQGLEAVFDSRADFNVVGSIAHVSDAIDQLEELQPQIIVLGMNAEVDSVCACAEITENEPDIKILLLAPPGSEEMVISAFKNGADACLLNDVVAKDLLQTIEMVAKGQMVVPQEVASKGLVERRKKPRNIPNLSIRELEVLQHMANGLRNKDIAKELFLSELTVKTHISRILRKLGKHNRTSAIFHAYKKGWINLPD